MWAQYAGNHTGVCIFFDRARLTQRMEEHFKNRGRLLHGAVSYDSGRMPRDNPFELSYDEIHRVGVGAFAKEHRRKYARQLYLTKNPDWASEQEYRYVWIDEDDECQDDAEYVSIKGCIARVCLGNRFPEVYEINMRSLKNQITLIASWRSSARKPRMGLLRPTIRGGATDERHADCNRLCRA